MLYFQLKKINLYKIKPNQGNEHLLLDTRFVKFFNETLENYGATVIHRL